MRTSPLSINLLSLLVSLAGVRKKAKCINYFPSS